MDTRNNSAFNPPFDNQKQNLSEIHYQNIMCEPNSMFMLNQGPNYYYYQNFLGKKREGENYLMSSINQNNRESTKCFMCYTSSPGKMVTCSSCNRTFHLTCLPQDEYSTVLKGKTFSFTCSDCRYRINQMVQINQRVPNNNNSYQFRHFPPSSTVSTPPEKSFPITQNDLFSNSLLQVLQNQNMTNEQRLNFLLKTDNRIKIHPLISKVLSIREKKRQISNSNMFYKNGVPVQSGIGSPNNLQRSDSKKKYPYVQLRTTPQINLPTPHVNPNYPIDDKLLFENKEKYEIDPNIFKRPEGECINIEFNIFNKLIIVWDFLITFRDTLVKNDSHLDYWIPFDFVEFYQQLSQENYFKKIVISFLFLAVKSLKILEMNLHDKDVYIVMTFLENPNSKPYLIFCDCICEILRVITTCLTNNYLIKQEAQNILAEVIEKSDINFLTTNQRVILLNTLVAIAYETVIIKGKIKEESGKRTNLLAEKSLLEETLKEAEKRKKEICKSEKFSTLNVEIEELNKKLEELKEEDTDYKKKKNEIETKIAKYQSILKESENLEERKNDIILKLKEIKEILSSLKAQEKRLLGFDYLKRQFYYFSSIPGKLLVKDNQKKKWFTLNKDQINETYEKLTEKGVHERRLKGYIKRIIKETEAKNEKEKKKEESIEKKDDTQLNDSDKTEEMKKEDEKKLDRGDVGIEKIKMCDTKETVEKKEGNSCSPNQTETADQDKTKDIEMRVVENRAEPSPSLVSQEDAKKEENDETLSMTTEFETSFTVNEILLKMEQKFSDYLSQFNKEWENEENRREWKEIITKTNNDSNFISSLKMFNHRFKNPYKSDIDSEDMNEEMEFEIPESTQKYVFEEEGRELVIYENDPNKILSPKVKIWPKDIELNEIDKYYTDYLLKSITNKEKLLFALHFYEDVIFGLIKRRETKKFSHSNMMNSLLPVEIGKR